MSLLSLPLSEPATKQAERSGDFPAMTETSWVQLSALATHLGEQRPAILRRWRVASESGLETTVALSLTRTQFNDHIPGILDAYAHGLQAESRADNAEAQKEEKEEIVEHGLQRWQQGYPLHELTHEWGQLHLCVMAELESYALARPELDFTVMPTARLAWSRLCWDGISDSTTQYWCLHQTEATGHVRDLELALATLRELDQTRAAAWRETAHDLQGSLSLVKLATSVLDRTDLPEPRRHEISDLVQRGVSSLHLLLTDFMSLARLDAGLEERQSAPFDAARLLADFCTTSQSLAQGRGLYLKMEGPESLVVIGDEPKIRRILQNLLLNALKYTQRGGVTLIWKSGTDRDTNKWMFCVQDTGPGLDEGPDAPMAKHLHEATQSAQAVEETASGDTARAPTASAQSGTLPSSQVPGEGVGLSIVKRLCELLDATLELETSPGAGSTFRVTLPRNY